jgi:AbrB family looped-hinge helix DNA binding protein
MDAITIDRFGRVLIPKAVRDRLGWAPGTVLQLDVGPEAIALAAADQGAGDQGITLRDGRVVYEASWQAGQGPEHVDPLLDLLRGG